MKLLLILLSLSVQIIRKMSGFFFLKKEEEITDYVGFILYLERKRTLRLKINVTYCVSFNAHYLSIKAYYETG